MLRRALIALFATPFLAFATVGLANAEPLTVLAGTSALITFDSASPGTVSSPITITGLQGGESILGIDRRPANGLLYGIGSTSRLYLINPTTGAATQVGSAGAFTLSGTAFGLDFNPVVDRLRVVSSNGQNLRINPNDGQLFTVGAMGFNTSDLVGFDISGLTGVAYAALTPPTGGSSQLFTINLTTGAATLVGTIGGGLTITGLAASVGSPVPEPTTLLLFATGIAATGIKMRRRWKASRS